MMAHTLNRGKSVEGWLHPMTNRLMQLPQDCAYIILNYGDNFSFDVEAARNLSGKRLVLLDFSEYGVNHSWQNKHIYGLTIQDHRQVESIAEILKLDEWLKQQKVAIYFKREFSQNIQAMIESSEVRFPVEPIEIFFDNLPVTPPADKEDYINRVGLIFHLFGNSHPDRKNLAGEMMKKFERICTGIPKMTDLINHRLPFHHVEQVEHLSRYSVGEVLHAQGKCLLSVNLSGFGCKAFRLREAYHNAVPIMADIGMRYSVQPNNDNAVMLPTQDGRLKIDESIAILEEALRDRENLWHRFQNAHTVSEMLAPDRYCEEQINRKIRKIL